MFLYHRLYYYYCRSLIKTKIEGSPEFVAALILSFMIFINIISGLNILEDTIKLNWKNIDKEVIITAYVILNLINLLYFYSKKRYQIIFSSNEKIEDNIHKFRGIIVLAYSILSIILLFVTSVI